MIVAIVSSASHDARRELAGRRSFGGDRQTASFAPTDALSDVARADYSTDGGTTWTQGTSAPVGSEGVTTLLYRSTDNAGNVETARSATVRIDSVRPVPKALTNKSVRKGRKVKLPYRASVVRGKRVAIGYKLADPANGCGSGKVKVVIKNARGKTMKSFSRASVPTNAKKLWKFRCRFPRGRYTIRVSGSDVAGNRGTKTATAGLTVR